MEAEVHLIINQSKLYGHKKTAWSAFSNQELGHSGSKTEHNTEQLG